MGKDLGRIIPLYQGDYSGETEYELNDLVAYDGLLYWHVAEAPTTGVLPTNSSTWRKIPIRGGGSGGGTIAMRVEDGYIQYSTDDATWINLIAVSELKGDKGDAFTYEDFTPEQLAALKGTPGNDGKSAYQIAVAEGFEGSEAEWLASLKGSPGYTPEKGRDYFDGKDGLTPYIGTNGNWFIGTVDTGLPSRGANGETPQKGVDYFTNADKTELVNAVLAALTDGDEVSY